MGPRNKKERTSFWNKLYETYSREQVAAAWLKLKPAAQEIILLHYKEGLTIQQIAERLKKSRSTIQSLESINIYKLYLYLAEPG